MNISPGVRAGIAAGVTAGLSFAVLTLGGGSGEVRVETVSDETTETTVQVTTTTLEPETTTTTVAPTTTTTTVVPTTIIEPLVVTTTTEQLSVAPTVLLRDLQVVDGVAHQAMLFINHQDARSRSVFPNPAVRLGVTTSDGQVTEVVTALPAQGSGTLTVPLQGEVVNVAVICTEWTGGQLPGGSGTLQR